MADAGAERGHAPLPPSTAAPFTSPRAPLAPNDARCERALRDASRPLLVLPGGAAAGAAAAGARAGRAAGRTRPSEVARFAASTSLGFPASEIQALDAADEARRDAAGPARMAVNFFGLTGPQGVLPHLYTEHAGDARARAATRHYRDFLDLFHHRVLSLFYRAWKAHRPAVLQEEGGEDRVHDHLLDLAGLGTRGHARAAAVPDAALAFYAGLLALRVRPADGLARLVGDYFDVPADGRAVRRRVAARRRRRPVHAGRRRRRRPARRSASSATRRGTRRRACGCASVPSRAGSSMHFLPGGAAHDALRALARLYAADEVGVDAQLVLARRRRAAVRARHAGTPRVRRATRLGRGTWLASRPLQRDPDETALRLC